MKPKAFGARNGNAKLTAAQVVDIRQRYHRGETGHQLAVEYCVTDRTVNHIVNRHTWRTVGGPINPHGRPGRRPRKEVQ